MRVWASLSQDEQYSVCQIQWNSTSSLAWREFSWKGLVRFFITPKQKTLQYKQYRLLETVSDL